MGAATKAGGEAAGGGSGGAGASSVAAAPVAPSSPAPSGLPSYPAWAAAPSGLAASDGSGREGQSGGTSTDNTDIPVDTDKGSQNGKLQDEDGAVPRKTNMDGDFDMRPSANQPLHHIQGMAWHGMA